MADIATLGLKVDGSELSIASDNLDELSRSAKGAQASAAGLEAGSGNLTRETNRLSISAKSAATSERIQANAMRASTVVANDNAKAFRSLGARRQQFIYQSNDVISGLIMGQSPMMVATQQGGQIAQVYGGQGGAAAAFEDAAFFARSLFKRLGPLVGVMALVGAGAHGMSRNIEDATGEAVTMGDVFKGTFATLLDGIDGVVDPIRDDLADAWEFGWQKAQEATGVFVNLSLQRINKMMVDIKLAFDIIAATGEFTWERIQAAILMAGEDVAEFVNTAINGYNALALVSPMLQTINAQVDFDATGQQVESLGSRINGLSAEADAAKSAISGIDYAGQLSKQITANAIVAKQRREAKVDEDESDRLAKQRARDRERALKSLSGIESKSFQDRLQQEGQTVALIRYRSNLELEAAQSVADRAIASGAERTQVEEQLGRAKYNITVNTQAEIDAFEAKQREKDLDAETKHQENLARLKATSQATIEQLTMSGALGTPQNTGTQFGEQAAFDTQANLFNEQNDLAALEQAHLAEMEVARANGEDLLAIQQEYEDLRTAIREQAANDRLEIEKASVRGAQIALTNEIGSLAGTLSNIVKEGSTAHRAMLAIQRSSALAAIAIAAPEAAAKAMAAYPPPFGQIMAGLVYANVLAQAASVAAVTLSGGREFGGSVNAGGLYEVGENGRPELFRSGNKSFLIPGNGGGSVTPERRTSAGNDNSKSSQVIIKHYHTHTYEISGVETEEVKRYIDEKQRETEQKVPSIMNEYEFDDARYGGGVR